MQKLSQSYFSRKTGLIGISLYGILSMGGDFAPGKSGFWVFWVIAIPLAFLMVLIFMYLPNKWLIRRLERFKRSDVETWMKESRALGTMV